MKYWTPQFIEIEDKIIGPLTIKQFVYIAGGIGSVILLNTFLPFFLALLLGAPIVVLGVALAFYKINNQSFVLILESGFRYLLHGRLYLWKKKTPKNKRDLEAVAKAPSLPVPKLSESKLRNLAWSLDIKDASNTSAPPSSQSNSVGKQLT
jgi:hypothetical protein